MMILQIIFSIVAFAEKVKGMGCLKRFTRFQRDVRPYLISPAITLLAFRRAGRCRVGPGVVIQLVKADVVQLAPVSAAPTERAAAIAVGYRIRGSEATHVALPEHTASRVSSAS